MPGFSAHPVKSVPDVPIQNDAATDASSQRQHAERVIPGAFSRASVALSQCRCVRITFDDNWKLKAVFQLGLQLQPFKAREIRGLQQPSGGQFKRPWAANADSDEVPSPSAFANQLFHSLAHVTENRIRSVLNARRYGNRIAADPVSGICGDTQIRAAKINSNGVRAHAWLIMLFSCNGS